MKLNFYVKHVTWNFPIWNKSVDMDSTLYKCNIIYLALSKKIPVTYKLFLSLQRVHRKTQITAENGISIDAMKVFTHCINYMREHLLKRINDIDVRRITMDDFYFVLTVPATWDDTAKMFMREAAVQVHTPHIEHGHPPPHFHSTCIFKFKKI